MNSNSFLATLSFLAIVILSCFSQKSDAIQCYVCNSGSMYELHDVCANIATRTQEAIPLIANCSTLPARDGLNWVRCRTMIQDVEGTSRIVRSCATKPETVKENRCIDRTGTSKIKIRYCECETDLCNGVSFLTPSLFILGFTALVATLKHFH